MKTKNIGLMAALSYIYEERKVQSRAMDEMAQSLDAEKLDTEFNHIIFMISEMNFKIKGTGLLELLNQALSRSENMNHTKGDGLTIFSDPQILYEICCDYILHWQTDYDAFCEKIRSDLSHELEWVVETIKDFQQQKMLIAYPYLKSIKVFKTSLENAKKGKDSKAGEIVDNLDLMAFLMMYEPGFSDEPDSLECFNELLSSLPDMGFEIKELSFHDLLHAALAEYLDVTYYSDPRTICECCCQYLLDENTDVFLVDEIIDGYNDYDIDWLTELVYGFVAHKVRFIYPYLKDEDAFVIYVESLKNNDNE
jgi:hypothetical protein